VSEYEYMFWLRMRAEAIDQWLNVTLLPEVWESLSK